MVGFLELLHDQKVAQTLLVHVDGERRLTNLLHLAELLQIASMEQPGISGLLRWFSEQREANSEGKEAEMRLESDQQLVQIVTIHKSKGLEYPVVFLPFPGRLGGGKTCCCFTMKRVTNSLLTLAVITGRSTLCWRKRRAWLNACGSFM